MNLATFRSRVSGAIGLSNSAGTERDLIDSWLNEGVVDFCRRTKIQKKLLSVTMTTGEWKYTLDTDILALEKLWVNSSTENYQDRMLEPVDSAEIFRMRNTQEPVDLNPVYYSIEGAHLILLHPAARSSSDTLEGIYVPRPVAMTVVNDTPAATANGGIPEEYHPAIEAYAKYRGADYADDQSSNYGQTYIQEYMMWVAEAKRDLTLKGGVRLAGIRPGVYPRRMRVPATPGTDLKNWN